MTGYSKVPTLWGKCLAAEVGVLECRRGAPRVCRCWPARQETTLQIWHRMSVQRVQQGWPDKTGPVVYLFRAIKCAGVPPVSAGTLAGEGQSSRPPRW